MPELSTTHFMLLNFFFIPFYLKYSCLIVDMFSGRITPLIMNMKTLNKKTSSDTGNASSGVDIGNIIETIGFKLLTNTFTSLIIWVILMYINFMHNWLTT
jgi:hypothetical protein